VRHALLSRATSLKQVRRVVSPRAIALGQCRGGYARTVPGVPTVAVASNAPRRAQSAALEHHRGDRQRRRRRALRPARAGRNVQDLPHNVTRFVVIGRPNGTVAQDADKVSLLFSVKNRAGMLFRVLKPLSERGIDL
jgi:chorismate mutase/prephenate dehydratase